MKKLMTSTVALGIVCMLEINQPVQASNTESAAPQTILVHGGGGSHHSGGGSHHSGGGSHRSGGGSHHSGGGSHHSGSSHHSSGNSHHHGHHGHGYGYGWGAAAVGAAIIGADIIYENTSQGNEGYQEYPMYPNNYQENQPYPGSYGPQVYEYNN